MSVKISDKEVILAEYRPGIQALVQNALEEGKRAFRKAVLGEMESLIGALARECNQEKVVIEWWEDMGIRVQIEWDLMK